MPAPATSTGTIIRFTVRPREEFRRNQVVFAPGAILQAVEPPWTDYDDEDVARGDGLFDRFSEVRARADVLDVHEDGAAAESLRQPVMQAARPAASSRQ